ncbi:SurA N-terminal domain-containing protein [Brachybacterium sp. GCM10030267]|uniref:SurA N-terminal domain-containing protein n=1 Tax=unclassified Brachybacterium TaxID=2623841 RepID=UPI003620F019
MKVPSTSTIRNTLAAASLAAVVALAGCSGDQAAPSGASDGGGQQPSVSDGGGQPPAPSDGGGQQAQPDVSDVPDVVAEVNGEEITKDEFVQAYESQFQQASMQQQQQGGGEPLDQAKLKEQVAAQLIDNRLVLQAADDAGITPTEDDIDAQLEQFAAQQGAGSVDELVKAAEQQGISEEDLRADASDNFQLTGYVDQEAGIEEPSEEEVKKQYDQLVEQSKSGGQQPQSGGQQQEIPPFEDARDKLAEDMLMKQRQEALPQITEDLREQGEVTVNL